MSFAVGPGVEQVGGASSSTAGATEAQRRGEQNEASEVLSLLRALVAAQGGEEEEGSRNAESSREVMTLQDLKGLLSELLLQSGGLTSGGTSVGAARGIVLKEKQDEEFRNCPK